MINTRYPYPFLVATGEIVTSGHYGDLKNKSGAVSVGLYNGLNTANQYYIATGSGNGDKFFIGYSSTANKDNLGKWHFGRTNPYKSEQFRGKDLISFEFSDPSRIKHERWTIGYNGVAGCNEPAFNFECGKTYGLQFILSGNPVFRNWAKYLIHDVYVTTPCCDSSECTSGCEGGEVDCEWVVSEFAKKINEHVELSKIGVHARYITNDYEVTAPTHYDYCLSVCDGGGPTDLAAVQATLTVGKAERIGRDGGVSSYKVTCIPSIPGSLTPFQYSVPADCDTCGAGYTLAFATDVYNIVANEATYANAAAVTTAYQNASLKTFTGVISAPNITANQIPVTAHGFVTGQKVVYTDGGGTAIIGLTTATNYYVIKVDANTVKLATTAVNAIAGTAIDITATGVGVAHTLTASGYSTVLSSSNPTTETYQLSVEHGDVVTALGNDVALFAYTVDSICVPASASPIAWVECGSHYKTTRQLCMTLKRKDCDAGNHLADLQAFYANDPTYVANSLAVTAGVDCFDKYTLSQYSNCMDDGCLSKDSVSFPPIMQGYSNGTSFGVWEVVEVALPAYDAAKKCGLEITAEVEERFLSDCVMDLHDYYEVEPIRIEVGWIQNQLTGLPDVCDVKGLPKAQRVDLPQYSNQSGEWVLREYIKAGAYELWGCDNSDAKLREILDQNRRAQVDRKAFYRIYYIQYKADKGNGNNFDEKAEVWETMIAFKEGDPKIAAFEAAFGSVFSKYGITLKERV